MKKRLPTPDEIREWRASNRFTDKKHPEDESIEDDDALHSLPRRGKVGVGAWSDSASANAPLPASTRQGEGKKRGALAPLKSLSLREMGRVLRSHGPVEATLDLHGMGKPEAYARVQQFVACEQRQGRRHLAIITGKGRGGEVGVLRQVLPHWLNEAPLRAMVAAFGYARPEKGGAGVLHVLVKRV